MYKKWNLIIILALLLGLVFTSPAHTVLAASDTAYFEFTSSANPSDYRQEVTFSLFATGTDSSNPPLGSVNFYDNDSLICEGVRINLTSGYLPSPNTPATCTIATLVPGTHEIKAFFYSLMPLTYADETIYIEGGQVVNDTIPVTITPKTLPDVEYGIPFRHELTGTCGEGLSCGFIVWRLKSGYLPSGMKLESYGEIWGSPTSTGSFKFTLEAFDFNDSTHSLGTETYTWNVLKATPKVTFGDMRTYYGKTYLDVIITHPDANWTPNPAGTVTVTVDDPPVEVCTDLGPIPNMPYLYTCVTTDELVGLIPGSHTLHADFTPDEYSVPNYNSASGDSSFTNPPRIEGLQFNDLDRDGVRDIDEESSYIGYVNLDRDCDGSSEEGTSPDNLGQFSLNITPGDYCLSVQPYGNWYQSTTLEQFTVEATTLKHFEIGFYESQLTYDPMELPNASVGQFYSQTITISGGVPPYKLISTNQSMPDGIPFVVIFVGSSFTISGIPTSLGEGYVSLDIEDAEGMKGTWSSSIQIREGGVFNLTSSKNPSTSGEEVTFTFTGYGGAEIAPIGSVAFYDGDELIYGCEQTILNFNIATEEVGNYPATCTTSTLTEGTHSIKATFTDETWLYNNASLTLTQQVGGVTNTAPTANPGGPYLAAIDTAIAFDGSLSSDADKDNLTYVWDFGNGSISTGVLPTHTYASADIYDVCLTVNDGTEDSLKSCTIVVVYDPSDGFVTGGGWIDSPVGAYKLDETLSGKATFGFVSKYLKGKTIPTGNTEFQFQAGVFKFQSNAYEWLVVSKDKITAQFKGSGIVNGAMDPNNNAYKFMLWAADGSPDTFRIRIWWEDVGGVEHDVYDNGFNQSIGGGSIVVHTSK